MSCELNRHKKYAMGDTDLQKFYSKNSKILFSKYEPKLFIDLNDLAVHQPKLLSYQEI